jgi:hypothetical protein
MAYFTSQFNVPLGHYLGKHAKPLEVLGYVNEDVDGEEVIKDLIVKNDRNEKLIKLFEAQLLLPVEKRNQTLMKRFGITTEKNGTVDGWPESNDKRLKFFCQCTLPVDRSIPDTSRLNTKYATLGLFDEPVTGNTYFFYFPISKHGVGEAGVYKIDNMDTLIYTNGEPVTERGEYTLYRALYDYLHNLNPEDYMAYFQANGMVSPQSGVTLQKRGLGIIVNYYIKNAGNQAKKLLFGTPDNEKPKPEAVADPSSVSDDALNKMLVPVDANVIDPVMQFDDFINADDKFLDPVEEVAEPELEPEPTVDPEPEPVVTPAPSASPQDPLFDEIASSHGDYKIKFLKVTNKTASGIFVSLRKPSFLIRKMTGDTIEILVIRVVHNKQITRGVDDLDPSYRTINSEILKNSKFDGGKYATELPKLDRKLTAAVDKRMKQYSFGPFEDYTP